MRKDDVFPPRILVSQVLGSVTRHLSTFDSGIILECGVLHRAHQHSARGSGVSSAQTDHVLGMYEAYEGNPCLV